MTNLVLQSFGKEREYNRAILTVLSYYAYTSLSVEKTRVILFTDKPEYFSDYLGDLPVSYILLTSEKIAKMRGEIDFLHRMKIALIEEAFTMIEGNMLYADSDTFFTADPTPLMNLVSEVKCFMHLKEFSFEEVRDLPLPAGKTNRDFVDLINSKSFELSNKQRIKVTPQHFSWNAGVMMFHKSHEKYINDVYSLTDQFYPESLHHASEQFAFSVVLQHNVTIEPCDSVIYHYWYRVKKEIIDLFLHKEMNDLFVNLSFDMKLNVVKDWSGFLPKLFNEHVLTLRDNAIQAFNENDFKNGFIFAFKALTKAPGDIEFIKNLLYHSKRKFKRNI